MGIDNAVIASDFIRCDKIIGMHYNTYETIKIDKEEAHRRFDRTSKELILMNIGDTLTIG